jgi:hypothetical protein
MRPCQHIVNFVLVAYVMVAVDANFDTSVGVVSYFYKVSTPPLDSETDQAQYSSFSYHLCRLEYR